MMDNVTQLIEQHRDYVRALAHRIARQLPPGVDIEELVAFGDLGLVEAAGRYDPARGAAFQTFAYYRIRGAIFDGLRKMLWLPPSLYKRLQSQAGADEIAKEQSGAVADDPDAQARHLAGAVRDMATIYVLSMDADDQGNGLAVSDDDPALTVERQDAIEGLREAIEALPDRKQLVIRGYYFEGRTLTEVAAELGISRFYASRLHTEAVRELRGHLESPQPAHRSRSRAGRKEAVRRAACVA